MLTLTAKSRLRVLWPHGPLPEGLVTLPVDLAATFRNAAEIGPDRTLLLLTIRALRQRGFVSDAPVADLRWMLGVSRWWIARQLQRLAATGQLVFEGGSGRVVQVELTGAVAPAHLFGAAADTPSVRHEVPTHWFTQHLPRLGRRAFLAYLYLRSREAAGAGAALNLRELSTAIGARGAIHARLLLARLRCFGLLQRGAHGLMVVDPPPVGPFARLFLRLVSSGAIPPTPWGRRLALLLCLVPFAGLAALVL